MAEIIDQRAQRHDPASRHTEDPTDRPDTQTKQPGRLPPEGARPHDAHEKANVRDSGTTLSPDVPPRTS